MFNGKVYKNRYEIKVIESKGGVEEEEKDLTDFTECGSSCTSEGICSVESSSTSSSDESTNSEKTI